MLKDIIFQFKIIIMLKRLNCIGLLLIAIFTMIIFISLFIPILISGIVVWIIVGKYSPNYIILSYFDWVDNIMTKAFKIIKT